MSGFLELRDVLAYYFVVVQKLLLRVVIDSCFAIELGTLEADDAT